MTESDSVFGGAEVSSASADPWSLPDGMYEGAISKVFIYEPDDLSFRVTNVEFTATDGRSYTQRLYHPQESDTPAQRQRKLSNMRKLMDGLEIPESRMDSATADDILDAGRDVVFELQSNTAKNGRKYQNMVMLKVAKGSPMRQTIGEATGVNLEEFTSGL